MNSEDGEAVRIGFINCGGEKADERCRARHLYTSSYFSAHRSWAEECCDEWRILSAKHGLVHPDQYLDPYDATLNPAYDAYIGDDAVEAWGERVRATVVHYAASLPRDTVFEIACAEDYARHLDPLADVLDIGWEFPFRSDEISGMFDQMGWLKAQREGE